MTEVTPRFKAEKVRCEMTTLHMLINAIHERQADRMCRGEPEMTEMWLAPETYDMVMFDAKQICVYPGPRQDHPVCCGVTIRRIGDG